MTGPVSGAPPGMRKRPARQPGASSQDVDLDDDKPILSAVAGNPVRGAR